MSYKIDPVDAMGAYSPYLRCSLFPDYPAQAQQTQAGMAQQTLQVRWAAFYRGDQPIGSTPPDMARRAQAAELRRSVEELRFIRPHYLNHPVLRSLPDASLRWRSAAAWQGQGIFTAQPPVGYPAHARLPVTAMRGQGGFPSFLTRRAPPGTAGESWAQHVPARRQANLPGSSLANPLDDAGG